MIDHLAHLRADSDAVLAVLRRSAGDEPVAACPGWTLHDLVEHLGGVHRWARQILLTGQRVDETPTAGDRDLAGWFAEGAEALLETLAAADPAAATWSFTADRTAGFWRRRQALETVVHRWDAQQAAGEPEGIDPPFGEPRRVGVVFAEPLDIAGRVIVVAAGVLSLDLGYSTLYVPDHFTDQLAPVPALTAT